MTQDEVVITGTDDEIEWVLVDPTNVDAQNPQGTPYDFVSLGVTKMELCIDCKKFTSDNGDITFHDGGRVVLKLGSNTTVMKDIKHNITLLYFTNQKPNGVPIVNRKFKESDATIELRELCC